GQPHRPLIATEDQPMPVRKMVIKVDKALFA
ncbi:MAG: YhcH/YjgK/YiaL family protein, partial [Vibrionaceae bacterium]